MVAFAAFVWFCYNAAALFFTYPPPWPDEALFADVSTNLLRHGRLATDLYADFFPAMRQHYYLTPPLYHALIAGWFGLFGVSLGALRAFSVLAAAGVVAVTFAIGRRVGLSRTSSLVPCVLLMLDAVFLRASLLGRMDMLALLFILLTVWLALGSVSNDPGPAGLRPSRRAFLLGLISALAALTHPIGAVAIVVSVAWAAWMMMARPEAQASAREVLLPVLLGIGLGFLPWTLYASRDFHAFAEQMGGQFQRKASRHSIFSCWSMSAGQWGVDPRILLGAWLAGTGGLALLSRRRSLGLSLAALQILITAVILGSCEMWYPVYGMPLTYLGGAGALTRFQDSPSRRRVVTAGIAVLALLFAGVNVARVSRIRGDRNPFYGAEAGYTGWCEEIGDHLVKHSVVLLDLLPTPYFGLSSRPDLSYRLLPPAGFPVPEGRVIDSLEGMNYIIAGRTLGDPNVRSFLMSHGDLVAEIGERRGRGYYAAVIRVNTRQTPSQKDARGIYLHVIREVGRGSS